MNQAWELLFEGKIEEAKKLVESDFSLETCTDFSLLNLMGYIYLEEQNYKECLRIYQRYIDLARTKSDQENEHVGLSSVSDGLQGNGSFSKSSTLYRSGNANYKKIFSQ